MTKLKLGIALGSGSARGWSHIGILKALNEKGIFPDIVCGTSVGAIVGASYVSNNIKKLESWVRTLTKIDIARFLEINHSFNGFVNQERLHHFLHAYVAGDSVLIEESETQYAAISTELATGREVWHMDGPILEAVCASMSLPGLFPAIKSQKRWLVDGGLVNPVPVSVCKALGADIVIAVNLNGDLIGRHYNAPEQSSAPVKVVKAGGPLVNKVTDFMVEYTGSLFPSVKSDSQPPGLFDAIAGSVHITQDRITRSRLAGDPPDLLIAPRLSHIGLLEIYRANEAISEGEESVRRLLPEIKDVLELV